jgi:hypothetical protein
MDPSLGARLRAHREQQQVTLDAVSAETKIKLCVLEGLERDDVSQWPEGIYRRAYVRAYARAIGLNPEEALRDFLQFHPDPVVAPPASEHTELETPPWPAEFRRLVTSALAAVPARRQSVERPAPEPPAPEPPPTREVAAAPAARTRAVVPDLLNAAELCARLGRASDHRGVTLVLEDAARALDAVGVIVWAWDDRAAGLTPLFACGYADDLIARMPVVRRDDDNGLAAAFRSADTYVVAGRPGTTGAVIAPLLSRGQCVGVLAAETRDGGEQRGAVRALASILAVQFVPFLETFPLAQAVNA